MNLQKLLNLTVQLLCCLRISVGTDYGITKLNSYDVDNKWQNGEHLEEQEDARESAKHIARAKIVEEILQSMILSDSRACLDTHIGYAFTSARKGEKEENTNQHIAGCGESIAYSQISCLKHWIS